MIDGINIVELIFKVVWFSQKARGKKNYKNNGIRINDEIISDEKKIINIDSFSR